MRIRFLRDEIFETQGRFQGPRYTAGEEYEMSDDQGNRWLRRGAAVEAEAPKPPARSVVPASAPAPAVTAPDDSSERRVLPSPAVKPPQK